MGARTIRVRLASALRPAALILGIAAVGSACGAAAQGEQPGAASADLFRLADQVTTEALECARGNGASDAFISANGGIVSGISTPVNIVPDCFAEVLESPEYAVFADDSTEMLRISYDGLVVTHECLMREGFTEALRDEVPTFEAWVNGGRSWSPFEDMARAGVDRIEAASRACEPG